MNLSVLFFLLFFLGVKTIAQVQFIPSSCYNENFILDKYYEKDKQWKYLPIKKDSLFLEEIITITISDERIKDKNSEKHFNNSLQKLGKISNIYYTEFLGKGTLYNNQFYEYIFYNKFNIFELNYVRDYYVRTGNRTNVYTFNYVAKIPINWNTHDKWNFSIQHYLKKIGNIKQIFNRCRIFE